MKFASVLALLAFTSAVAAVPAPSSEQVEVLIALKIDDAATKPVHLEKIVQSNGSKDTKHTQNPLVESGSQVCWRVCFPEKPNCPEGWTATQFGECWTCCLDTDD